MRMLTNWGSFRCGMVVCWWSSWWRLLELKKLWWGRRGSYCWTWLVLEFILLLLMASCWMKVVLLTIMLPRLMVVLSWKEKKMVLRLVFFFFLVQVEIMERLWKEAGKCDVRVGPGVVLSSVFENKGERVVVVFFSFKKHNKFVLSRGEMRH